MILLLIRKKNSTNSDSTSFLLLNENDFSLYTIHDLRISSIKFIETYKYNSFISSVTHDDNNIYISYYNTIYSFDINTFKFQKIISKSSKNVSGQIYYSDGYIYRCDDAVNCVTKINVKTLKETYIDIVEGTIIPKLHNCNFQKEKSMFFFEYIFIQNNKLHIGCVRYIDLLTNDNKNKLKIYKNEMNYVSDFATKGFDKYYNDVQKEIWNNVICCTNNSVTRANSFDDIHDTEDSIEKYIFGIYYKNNNIHFEKEVVFNIETNSVECVDNVYLEDSIGLLVINDFIWSICKGNLIKSKTSVVSIYKIEDPLVYTFIDIKHNNNNIYIIASNNYIENLPSLLFIFNINTEKLERKILNHDILKDNYIMSLDII